MHTAKVQMQYVLHLRLALAFWLMHRKMLNKYAEDGYMNTRHTEKKHTIVKLIQAHSNYRIHTCYNTCTNSMATKFTHRYRANNLLELLQYLYTTYHPMTVITPIIITPRRPPKIAAMLIIASLLRVPLSVVSLTVAVEQRYMLFVT